ncbi:hypothetical protein PIB30_096375 [Stylosanthes scabra]|uniref:Uncharacterized protein n=1 Tax=Stylosanthes scabra TaxID=79078 RepID=A0ABU6TWM3_9FABA|nr:hypothetical protein [Stylosanthes scabra]
MDMAFTFVAVVSNTMPLLSQKAAAVAPVPAVLQNAPSTLHLIQQAGGGCQAFSIIMLHCWWSSQKFSNLNMVLLLPFGLSLGLVVNDQSLLLVVLLAMHEDDPLSIPSLPKPYLFALL